MSSGPFSGRPVGRAALLLTAVATLALAGCSSSSSDGAASPANTPPTVNTTPQPSPSDDSRPAALIAEENGGSTTCVSQTKRRRTMALYDPIAKADGDLTITDAIVTGHGVRLMDSQGVLVTSRPAFGPGAMIGGGWPIQDLDLARRVDLGSRTNLVGMQLAAGDRVLPLAHVRVNPGARLDGLRLTYTAGAADSDATEVVLHLGTRFAKGKC